MDTWTGPNQAEVQYSLTHFIQSFNVDLFVECKYLSLEKSNLKKLPGLYTDVQVAAYLKQVCTKEVYALLRLLSLLRLSFQKQHGRNMAFWKETWLNIQHWNKPMYVLHREDNAELHWELNIDTNEAATATTVGVLPPSYWNVS